MQSMLSKQQEEVGGEEGHPCNVLRYNKGRSYPDTLSVRSHVNTECNPLHGPRVEEIIQKLEAGEEVEKQAYVDEVASLMMILEEILLSTRITDYELLNGNNRTGRAFN